MSLAPDRDEGVCERREHDFALLRSQRRSSLSHALRPQAEGGVVGVDIDHCLEQGALSQIASEIVRRYPTYTEVSPSGTGLHLFYRGTMVAKGNKNSDTGVEMYAHSRFFTMTGTRLENTPAEIADGTEALP